MWPLSGQKNINFIHDLPKGLFVHKRIKAEKILLKNPNYFDRQLLIDSVRHGNLDLLKWMYVNVLHQIMDRETHSELVNQAVIFAQCDVLVYLLKLSDNTDICDEDGRSILQSNQMNNKIALLLLSSDIDITLGIHPTVLEEVLMKKRKKMLKFLLDNVTPKNVKSIKQMSELYSQEAIHVQYFYIEICKYIDNWFNKNLYQNRIGIVELLNLDVERFEIFSDLLYNITYTEIDDMSGAKNKDDRYLDWMQRIESNKSKLPKELYIGLLFLLLNKQDTNQTDSVFVLNDGEEITQKKLYKYTYVREFAREELFNLGNPAYSVEYYGLLLPDNWHKDLKINRKESNYDT